MPYDTFFLFISLRHQLWHVKGITHSMECWEHGQDERMPSLSLQVKDTFNLALYKSS